VKDWFADLKGKGEFFAKPIILELLERQLARSYRLDKN
jgi:hypothetical protein